MSPIDLSNYRPLTKKYNVILADPPWDFDVYSAETGHGRSAESHYRTMTTADICRLPIWELAADDCALFMWGVWPKLPDALEVIAAWGGQDITGRNRDRMVYKTLGFEWWKLNKGWAAKWLPATVDPAGYRFLEGLFKIGMGFYTRANSEPCLLSVRGSMPVASRAEKNFIIAPIGEHSEKPAEQYEKIEALYPGAAYVELFARNKSRPGWSYFGNEIDSDLAIIGGHFYEKIR